MGEEERCYMLDGLNDNYTKLPIPLFFFVAWTDFVIVIVIAAPVVAFGSEC